MGPGKSTRGVLVGRDSVDVGLHFVTVVILGLLLGTWLAFSLGESSAPDEPSEPFDALEVLDLT